MMQYKIRKNDVMPFRLHAERTVCVESKTSDIESASNPLRTCDRALRSSCLVAGWLQVDCLLIVLICTCAPTLHV